MAMHVEHGGALVDPCQAVLGKLQGDAADRVCGALDYHKGLVSTPCSAFTLPPDTMVWGAASTGTVHGPCAPGEPQAGPVLAHALQDDASTVYLQESPASTGESCEACAGGLAAGNCKNV
jgi:hypothetical protein